MRFHLLAPAHHPLTSNISHCAFTMKVINMAKMIKNAGHYLIVYGMEQPGEVLPYDEYVECVSHSVFLESYGPHALTSYNYGWNYDSPPFGEFREKAKVALALRAKPEDIILSSFGNVQEGAIPENFQGPVVEMGIGYEGVFAEWRVYESYAWQHFIYGKYQQEYNASRDTVIPNYINPNDFEFRKDKEDYALYLGRVIESKGIHWACYACMAMNIHLIVVGYPWPDEYLTWLKDQFPTTEFRPFVGPEERKELLAKAKVVLCPTQYIEPFGGVAVEAMYSGTPVISTDWGAFTETIIQGQTGFRIRSIPEMRKALEHLDKINPQTCHEWASQFQLNSVWPKYEKFFTTLLALREA